MRLVRSIFAVLLLALLAQNALACTERGDASAQPQVVAAASDIVQLAENGAIGEERPNCECPCPPGASASAVSESGKSSHSIGASDCARPWSVVQPLAPARAHGHASSDGSPPTPRFLLVARLLQ